ncbi:PPOD2 peroxidase-like [Labilithrix luteola]|uniref:PPOD2 peroxidase-like n=1 Tax=Labilithrix luteola TaxID=1391654 RepID=A0A0K1PYU5_9BACT|nr:hypothetical protein [Labilithrix luteola]AKU98698.1 PPOD2 peroxidase-like [Labilithrix luteola]
MKRKITHAAALALLVAIVGVGTLPAERADAQGATGSVYILNFRAYNGQFVVAEWGGGREVKADRNAAGDWERFVVIDLNGGDLVSGDKVHVRAQNKKYVVAENGMVKANRDAAGTWETFTITKVGGSGPLHSNDKINLRAWDGRYVVAERGGGAEVKADRTKAAEWETFTVTVRNRLTTDPSPLGTTWSPSAPPPPPAPPLPPDGYTLVGQPGCDIYGDPSSSASSLGFDSAGYYCCKMAQGSSSARCGNDHHEYPANCMQYAPYGQLLQPYGCVRRN